jgi:hypothetical protein
MRSSAIERKSRESRRNVRGTSAGAAGARGSDGEEFSGAGAESEWLGDTVPAFYERFGASRSNDLSIRSKRQDQKDRYV